MSRLGDLITLERTRRGLSAKQVAKKNGVSEKCRANSRQAKVIQWKGSGELEDEACAGKREEDLRRRFARQPFLCGWV